MGSTGLYSGVNGACCGGRSAAVLFGVKGAGPKTWLEEAGDPDAEMWKLVADGSSGSGAAALAGGP